MKQQSILRAQRTGWFMALALSVWALDQITKWYVVHHFEPGRAQEVFSWLSMTLSYNPGAAFSFLGQADGWQVILLSALAIIVIVVLFVWTLLTQPQWQVRCAIALVIGGAAGNLSDRVRQTYVTDFIQVHLHDWYFAVFNAADAAISIGAFVLIWAMWRQKTPQSEP